MGGRREGKGRVGGSSLACLASALALAASSCAAAASSVASESALSSKLAAVPLGASAA